MWQGLERSPTPGFTGPHGGDDKHHPICHGSHGCGGHDRESGVMKRAWHPDELVEHWTILPEEQQCDRQ